MSEAEQNTQESCEMRNQKAHQMILWITEKHDVRMIVQKTMKANKQTKNISIVKESRFSPFWTKWLN